MRLFDDLPVKRKLTLISLSTCTTALLVAGVSLFFYEQFIFKRALVNDLATTAQIIGFNSASALSFDDAESATQTLQSLRAQSEFEAACIYDRHGNVFATYPATLAVSTFGKVETRAERFTRDYLELFRPIDSNGEAVGTIYLRTDLSGLRQRLRGYVTVGLIVLLFSILAASVIAARLQRIISVPVSDLVSTASRVAAEQNYALRVAPRGRDELGRLIEVFNDMLAQIQHRDSALQAAQSQLEKRVIQRTEELQRENTERRRAEQALQASEGFLQSLVETLPVYIFRKDCEGRFTFANQLFCRRRGQSREEILGKTATDLLPADEARLQDRIDRHIVETGETYEATEEHVLPNGERTFIHIIKVPVLDASGRCEGVQGMFLDVTARKQVEARLAEATEKLAYERDQLRALLDASPDTIYFKDLESRFVLVSRSKVRNALERLPDLRERRATKQLSRDVPEMELLNGLTDFDTYQEEDARLAFDDEQQIIRTGEALIGKLEKQTFLDGTQRWNLTSKMPWRDAQGNIIGTFGLSKDVTAQKLAEENMEQLNRQLRETSRQAGMAEVATGVLHNVGNVLNSVNVSATLVSDHVRHTKGVNVAKLSALFEQNKNNLAEFLTKDPRGQMIPAYLGTLAEGLATEHQAVVNELDQLRKNVEHIKEIVAMQQAYARTSGVTETVSVPDLVEDALRMNAGSLARHDVDTVREYQARPVVTTDKHKVMQILINLVRNAKYACDESGRTDKRIVVRATADGHRVRISITDNGVGIPSENLTRIFAHGFTTRKHGHGFGLHSGALAARELGGSLTVHSEGPGKGATFILELPYKPEPP